jgi:hypothetical protein
LTISVAPFFWLFDFSAYTGSKSSSTLEPVPYRRHRGRLIDVLGEAGADPGTKDRLYQGTPLDWAEHLQRKEIAAYLRARSSRPEAVQ